MIFRLFQNLSESFVAYDSQVEYSPAELDYSCIDEIDENDENQCARLQCESDLMSIGRLVSYMKENLDPSTWTPVLKSECQKGSPGRETNMCCLTNLNPVFATTENGENECDFATDKKYFFELEENIVKFV